MVSQVVINIGSGHGLAPVQGHVISWTWIIVI